MRFSRIAAPLLCSFAVACATASAPVPSGPPPDWKLASASMAAANNFQAVFGNGGQVQVQITGHDIYGASFNLSAGGGFVRGQGGGGAIIDVTIKGNRADGSVKGAPYSLIVTENPDGSAHATGAMGVGNTDFIMSPKEITGRIGAAVISMAWVPANSRYEGTTMPGGQGWVQLPAVMATWSPVEVMTVFTVLMNN